MLPLFRQSFTTLFPFGVYWGSSGTPPRFRRLPTFQGKHSLNINRHNVPARVTVISPFICYFAGNRVLGSWKIRTNSLLFFAHFAFSPALESWLYNLNSKRHVSNIRFIFVNVYRVKYGEFWNLYSKFFC